MSSHFPNIYSNFRANLQKFQRTRLCTKKSETWCVSFLCHAAKGKIYKEYLKKNENHKKPRQSKNEGKREKE
jgi:hypothetical protein